MSGDPKTRVMTLEEAMREVHFVRLDELREKHGNLADVQVTVTEDGWWVFLNEDGEWNNVKEFGIGEWEAAFSYALGYKVVAPDEVAELREENKRLRASVDDLLLAPNPLDDENMRLRAALTFAQSVIKSGEPWSPTCDEIIGGALAATEARDNEEDEVG